MPIITLVFDPVFHDKLESGQKTMTFRHGAPQAKYGDIFIVNLVPYQIDRILPGISLYDFVSHYWHDDGWDKPDDAVEWFKQHYFNGDVSEQYGPTFQQFKGCAYKFKKISPEFLKHVLGRLIDSFNDSLYGALAYLDILAYYEPEVAGYHKSYLEDVQYFLNEVNNNALLFDFEDKLFPPEEDAA